MQKILDFDSLDQNLLDSTASIIIFWIDSLKMQNLLHCTSQMQNRLDLIRHGGSGSCNDPSLDRRSCPALVRRKRYNLALPF
jgi:hypothetical protein